MPCPGQSSVSAISGQWELKQKDAKAMEKGDSPQRSQKGNTLHLHPFAPLPLCAFAPLSLLQTIGACVNSSAMASLIPPVWANLRMAARAAARAAPASMFFRSAAVNSGWR